MARKQIFTIEEGAKISGMDPSSLRVLLSRLERRGWIERIEKGKYMIIPLGAKKGLYTLNEFVIGSILIKPSAISYWSALNFHGLTEQIPTTVFVQTTSRKKKTTLKIFNVTYKFVRLKETKFFGLETKWVDRFRINITNKAKTIVDCLDKPKYCGGVIEIAKALTNDTLDFDLISTYATQIGNSGVIRRLGFLCDTLGIHIELPEIKVRNYLLLDPTLPSIPKVNSKWKLFVNLDIGELE
ncbi:MAG: type IV toxin-antitoxin system AbiEi family antitoxin domain-containing protein [Candidatus Thorarchaeota archaeon]